MFVKAAIKLRDLRTYIVSKIVAEMKISKVFHENCPSELFRIVSTCFQKEMLAGKFSEGLKSGNFPKCRKSL